MSSYSCQLESLSERKQDACATSLIDTCVMECYFRDHMAERDLLFPDIVAPYLASYDPAASEAKQLEFVAQLHATLNAPGHPVLSRLDRICTDSPDMLALIKQEGKE
jgi:adenine-specific DNA-methyltransferase